MYPLCRITAPGSCNGLVSGPCIAEKNISRMTRMPSRNTLQRPPVTKSWPIVYLYLGLMTPQASHWRGISLAYYTEQIHFFIAVSKFDRVEKETILFKCIWLVSSPSSPRVLCSPQTGPRHGSSLLDSPAHPPSCT